MQQRNDRSSVEANSEIFTLFFTLAAVDCSLHLNKKKYESNGNELHRAMILQTMFLILIMDCIYIFMSNPADLKLFLFEKTNLFHHHGSPTS